MATDPAGPESTEGLWGDPFDLLNVAIHAHLLPTGEVLYWGRRTEVGSDSFDTLNEHFCSTFLWNPGTGTSRRTAQSPQLLGNGGGVNLFCSGHSFLPDGRLFVIGGHLFDSEGVDSTNVYDPFADTWTALSRMNNGRWYPSALTLPDGSVLAMSGQHATGVPGPPPNDNILNPDTQIWRDNAWVTTRDFQVPPLYPRLHIEPKQGHIFMSGPLGKSYFLDVSGDGTWTAGPPVRDGNVRDFAPSVMYDSGKIIFIGGGQDAITQQPTNLAEIIDLNDAVPQWQQTAPMHFLRRQHNATVLPDGTVLVTGGTQDVAFNSHLKGFNNVDPGAPVRQAELWDPVSKQWTLMATEKTDRCYHSIALLLPDGRVLSAGGGEYAPENRNMPNPPGDSKKDAQLFSPPYLFKGPPPTFSSPPPTEITYGQEFSVFVDAGDTIGKVSWIRLGSVTHSCNMNQSLIFLQKVQQGTKITVQAPSSPNIAPPGHYMLFVVNTNGVPSIGSIIRIASAPATIDPAFRAATTGRVQHMLAAAPAPVNLMALNEKITLDQDKPPIILGVTTSCPYGLGACWSGAFHALGHLANVALVRPVPDTINSTAFLYPINESDLPDIDTWRKQFAKKVNGSYLLRGIEVTLSGPVSVESQHSGVSRLTMPATATRPDAVALAPLESKDKVQWDSQKGSNRAVTEDEASAFEELGAAARENVNMTVTGPLLKQNSPEGEKWVLQVRDFEPRVRGGGGEGGVKL